MSPPKKEDEIAITGRCYCGAYSIFATEKPETVAYCHCGDCKRWTGSPLPAFAVLKGGTVFIKPDISGRSIVKGVTRWVCDQCGSPLMARFDYLPDQVYLPIGILDQASNLEPSIHCHVEGKLPWLHLEDDLPAEIGSARDALNSKGQTR